MHAESSEFAGKTVKIKPDVQELGGSDYRVEDWWDKVTGKSWMFSEGNPAALMYAMRSGANGLPINDEVLYGKIGSLGYLVHISEIETT